MPNTVLTPAVLLNEFTLLLGRRIEQFGEARAVSGHQYRRGDTATVRHTPPLRLDDWPPPLPPRPILDTVLRANLVHQPAGLIELDHQWQTCSIDRLSADLSGAVSSIAEDLLRWWPFGAKLITAEQEIPVAVLAYQVVDEDLGLIVRMNYAYDPIRAVQLCRFDMLCGFTAVPRHALSPTAKRRLEILTRRRAQIETVYTGIAARRRAA